MKRLLYLIISLVLAMPLLAQDIFKLEENLFGTELIKKSKPGVKEGILSIKAPETLIGTIKISVSETNSVEISYTKKTKTSSKSKAFDYIDLISVELTSSGKNYKIEMRTPNPAPWGTNESGLVNLEVAVPEFYDILIEAVYFDIEAEGPFKNFSVPKSLGKIEIYGVAEKLEAQTSNRRLIVGNLTGAVDIGTTNSSLTAEDIVSPGKLLSFKNDGGDIELLNIHGQLNVKNKYGRIEIDQFYPDDDKSYIRGFNGPIFMQVISINKGQLIISNRFEDIDITIPTTIAAEMFLAVEEKGKIEISNFPFKPDLIQPNRINLISGDGSALINGSIRGNGNIYIKAEDMGE